MRLALFAYLADVPVEKGWQSAFLLRNASLGRNVDMPLLVGDTDRAFAFAQCRAQALGLPSRSDRRQAKALRLSVEYLLPLLASVNAMPADLKERLDEMAADGLAANIAAFLDALPAFRCAVDRACRRQAELEPGAPRWRCIDERFRAAHALAAKMRPFADPSYYA